MSRDDVRGSSRLEITVRGASASSHLSCLPCWKVNRFVSRILPGRESYSADSFSWIAANASKSLQWTVECTLNEVTASSLVKLNTDGIDQSRTILSRVPARRGDLTRAATELIRRSPVSIRMQEEQSSHVITVGRDQMPYPVA